MSFYSYEPFSARVSCGESGVLSDGRVVTSSWPDTYRALYIEGMAEYSCDVMMGVH